MAQDARELLTANLSLVERAVTYACRRNRLSPDDAEELASIVKLKLVENDYAIVRAYEGRSNFATYLGIVVQRMVLDYRIHAWGKWHPSAEAKRLGDVAVELEQLLRRDGRTFDEALTQLQRKHDGVTREAMQAIVSRLPERAPRHRDVPLEEAETVVHGEPAGAEENVVAEERRSTAQKLTALLSAAFAKMPDDDRLVLQLRFEQGMTVAQIARALGRDQKFLYRQIDRRMRETREEMLESGIAPADVLDVIGRDESYFAFDFGKHEARPSIQRDEKETEHAEEAR